MEKYDIEIGDIAMTVKTDENEDFVRFVVNELNDRIDAMMAKNPHCTRLEAALSLRSTTTATRFALRKRSRILRRRWCFTQQTSIA